MEVVKAGATSETEVHLDTYSATTNYYNYLRFRKSYSNTLGTKTPTIDTTGLGSINFQGVGTGNAFAFGAYIYAIQDGAAGVAIPTNMIFATSNSTGINPNQLVLHNDGNVGIGTTSPNAALEVVSHPANNYGDGIVIGQVNGDNSNSIQTYIDDGAGGGWATRTTYNSQNANPLYIQKDAGDLILGNTRGVSIIGTLSKGGGSFDISHPDPVKAQEGWRLRHSFVESPTRGDNLYRWVIEVNTGEATVQLPEYFKHLNENVQVWVSPKNHFGRAYGEVNGSLTEIVIKVDTDGAYNVLAIGTRKDELVKEYFDEKGVEYQK